MVATHRIRFLAGSASLHLRMDGTLRDPREGPFVHGLLGKQEFL